MIPDADARDTPIGKGLSGVVYRDRNAEGRDIVRKVFTASPVTKLIHYVFFGAPNAYIYCEPAIQCAVLRRRILTRLVPIWFAGQLQVADALGHDWSEPDRAFELHCEFVEGKHLQLRQPFVARGEDRYRQLVDEIMQPLQALLRDSGFDGLVWQAGLGNPVALNNFMYRQGLDGADDRDPDDRDAPGHWVWIDLESGVPALIPINPWHLLRFYLPRSIRHRRALFDDVDTDRLRQYLEDRREQLDQALDAGDHARLLADVDALAEHQGEWKSLPRHQRGVLYALAKQTISEAEAERFAASTLRWHLHLLRRWLARAGRALRQLPSTVANWVRRLAPLRMLRSIYSMLRSQDYRAQVARDYVGKRVDDWHTRRQLTDTERADLQTNLDAEESSSYLTDFGMHLAVKPLVKALQYWVMPGLLLAGIVDVTTVAIVIAAGGAVIRTAYTSTRFVQNAVRSQPRPWIALAVGVLPVIGNIAFPLQIVASSQRRGASIARFILYETMAWSGRLVPIWGGPDTRFEHMFNRWSDWLIRDPAPIKPKP